MKTKNIGFGEAVRELASQAGMQPYRFSSFDKEKDFRLQNYKNIHKEYSDYFNKELFNPNNEYALNYLNQRGLNNEIIKEFKLGYVPWKNNFYEELLKKYSEEKISLTGLYYKHDKSGKYIDRFNSRIIFPINNILGEPIAFGGRIIKDSKLAKYINSPETEFYKKGSMIFNLDKAKNSRSVTNEVIIVEGYMDVVSLHSAGIKNVIANSGTALTERQINTIWKFFSNPIICLDGDQSGQKAAIRIAEKLMPLINEENKIHFSIMPEGKDPDEYIKENGNENFMSLLKNKQIIQTYIWNYYLQKVDRNNPFEISKFEKEIKKFCYLIKDETLKKYVLEDFLEKIKKLTPIQNTKKNSQYFKFYNKKDDFQILNETKTLHKKNNQFSKIQIKEFSILFIMLNFLDIILKKVEDLSEVTFLSEKNENLKKLIIELLLEGHDKDVIQQKTEVNYKQLIKEINENSSIQIILKAKNDEAILEILSELLLELKELSNLKKIESLEKKLINNLDESSYSELIKLKSQLNRE